MSICVSKFFILAVILVLSVAAPLLRHMDGSAFFLFFVFHEYLYNVSTISYEHDLSLLSYVQCSKANNVLNMLRWSGPSASSFSDSYSDNSFIIETPPPTAANTITLRVRCKGKVHKFSVPKVRVTSYQKTM